MNTHFIQLFISLPILSQQKQLCMVLCGWRAAEAEAEAEAAKGAATAKGGKSIFHSGRTAWN